MTQNSHAINRLLQDALASRSQVKVDTIDRKQFLGRIIDIAPGEVKPYDERGTITVETRKGTKRMPAYAITNVKYA